MLEHSAEARRFYNSTRWKRCRESYINKVHGLCERCEKTGYIVHHKVYIDISNIHDPYVTLNHENLEYLCTRCHNFEHFGEREPIREGFGFDVEGNLIQL